jgi:hypothetical protein
MGSAFCRELYQILDILSASPAAITVEIESCDK